MVTCGVRWSLMLLRLLALSCGRSSRAPSLSLLFGRGAAPGRLAAEPGLADGR